MRTTKQLSKALVAIQEEAMERIKGYFKGKPYVRIIIDARQHLGIQTGINIGTVTEIHSNGDIFYTQYTARSAKPQQVVCRACDNDPLPADALLTILDELERMKKGKQLIKP